MALDKFPPTQTLGTTPHCRHATTSRLGASQLYG
jgi:hypothetical protein